MKKEEKGITLVALLITIVVLVILAVVAIKEITNNNIILYADSAAYKFKTEQENENIVIGQYDDYLKGNDYTQCSHQWEETVLTDATETTNGLKKCVCRLCKIESSVTIPAHICEFTYQQVSDEYRTTDRAPGYHCVYYYSCLTCGKAGTETFIYHDGITGWPEGYCDHCGRWYDFGDEYGNTIY